MVVVVWVSEVMSMRTALSSEFRIHPCVPGTFYPVAPRVPQRIHRVGHTGGGGNEGYVG